MADSPAEGSPVTGTFRHVGFFYQTADEYAAAIAGFLRDGLAAGEAGLAVVPAAKLSIIIEALGSDAPEVEFVDMTRMDRNPAWIVPRLRAFTDLHSGRRVRYVGEPMWAPRTPAELREAGRHEALINLAFAGADAEILCPYDTAELDPVVIADARRIHPVLLLDGRRGASAGYAVPSRVPYRPPPPASPPLPAPPSDAMSYTYRANLSEVRAFVFKYARTAGLTQDRSNDLMLAVSEVAANTLRHTRSHGSLDIWHDQHELICEVHDEGTITDPLAGRHLPSVDASGGHGLWLVHQLCDLVELRSDSSGTTIRMHMAIRASIDGG